MNTPANSDATEGGEEPGTRIYSFETGKEIEFLRHSLGDAHMKALGDVAAQHSFLESLVRDLIHRALGTGFGISEAVTARMQMRAMVKLAGLILNQRFPDHEGREAVKALLKTVEGVVPERNKDIHSMWTGGDGDAFRFSWNLGKKPAYEVEKRTPAQMHAFAEEIGRACYAVMKFMMTYYPRTPDPQGRERRPGEPRRRRKEPAAKSGPGTTGAPAGPALPPGGGAVPPTR